MDLRNEKKLQNVTYAEYTLPQKTPLGTSLEVIDFFRPNEQRLNGINGI